MIYEIRTYNLKLGQLNEYWERFSEKLPGRQELSKLGGHWYTEVGPLKSDGRRLALREPRTAG